MTPAKRNYGISDKEALAVVRSLQHWRHWLEGTKIPIENLTDHKNLEYFTKPRVLNRRQLRWVDMLNHYNYHITYRPGTQNRAADALSRRAELAPSDPIEERPTTLFNTEELTEITDEEYEECIATIIGQAILSDQEIQEKIRITTLAEGLPETVVQHMGLPYHADQV